MKNESAVPSLVAAMAALSAKVRRFDGKPLGEQNTKARLVDAKRAGSVATDAPRRSSRSDYGRNARWP